MKKVLDELRSECGQVRLDWAELVQLGAREKLRRIKQDRKESQGLRKAAADQIRTKGGAADVEAADEVKRSGWSGS